MTRSGNFSRADWIECVVLMASTWGALVMIPVALGGIGISWDALNHHIYLDWVAHESRFDRDFMPAAAQSLQYPYLYWPVFLLARAEVSGVTAGVVLATLNWTGAPAVWLISRLVIPGGDVYAISMRAMAVTLAFLSPVVLSLFDSTSNDLLATVPLIWSVTLALYVRGLQSPTSQLRMVAASGVLAGISVAWKLSNGPMAILLPLLWIAGCGSPALRWRAVMVGSGSLLIACVLTYLPWGLMVWRHIGNPIYPFCDACFEPLRTWLRWQP